jgi:hypothetical protein
MFGNAQGLNELPWYFDSSITLQALSGAAVQVRPLNLRVAHLVRARLIGFFLVPRTYAKRQVVACFAGIHRTGHAHRA